MSELLYNDLTGDILTAYRIAFKVAKNNRDYREGDCRNVLAEELRRLGHQVLCEAPIERRYRGQTIGSGRMDLVVDRKVAVEVKMTATVTENHMDQVRGYLRDANLAVGMVLTFGGMDRAYRRAYDATNDPTLTRSAA